MNKLKKMLTTLVFLTIFILTSCGSNKTIPEKGFEIKVSEDQDFISQVKICEAYITYDYCEYVYLTDDGHVEKKKKKNNVYYYLKYSVFAPENMTQPDSFEVYFIYNPESNMIMDANYEVYMTAYELVLSGGLEGEINTLNCSMYKVSNNNQLAPSSNETSSNETTSIPPNPILDEYDDVYNESGLVSFILNNPSDVNEVYIQDNAGNYKEMMEYRYVLDSYYYIGYIPTLSMFSIAFGGNDLIKVVFKYQKINSTKNNILVRVNNIDETVDFSVINHKLTDYTGRTASKKYFENAIKKANDFCTKNGYGYLTD